MKRNYDLAVIGAGSAGLAAATTAKRLGADVLLVEKRKTGGECLHTGCVPSKALIHAARIYHEMKHADRYGLPVVNELPDFGNVMDHVDSVVDSIYTHESPSALREMGIDVLESAATFTSPTMLQANGGDIEVKKTIICTGSSPLILPIEGLEQIPYLTNESVWNLRSLPESVLFIGGGPISLEMAQSFARFGSKVTVVEVFDRILPNEDAEISHHLSGILAAEGIRILTSSKVVRLQNLGDNVRVTIDVTDGIETLEVEKVFVSIGRAPNVDGLGLDRAGVRFTRRGIDVNQYLQTSAPEVYACGDVVGPYRFTHTAGYHAFVATRNALLGNEIETDLRVVPWVTFTDPEAARVGLTEKEAREQHDTVTVLRVPADSIDRSRTERKTEGLLKLVLDADDKILGAHVLAPHAGEFIHETALAMKNNLGIMEICRLIHAYPTYSEMLKKAATRYFRTKHQMNVHQEQD